MKRNLLAVAVCAASLPLLSTGALAAGAESETGAAYEEPSAAGSPQASVPDLSKSLVASHLIGKKVRNDKGDDIGELQTLVMDREGKVTYGILSQDGILGMGAETYAVPWERFTISPDNELTLDVDRDQVSSEFAAFEVPEEGEAGMEEAPAAGEQPESQ